MTDTKYLAHLSSQIAQNVANTMRDGLPNSLAHLEQIKADNEAIARTVERMRSDGVEAGAR